MSIKHVQSRARIGDRLHVREKYTYSIYSATIAACDGTVARTLAENARGSGFHAL